MILIARSRQLKMRDALSHPLGPLPWSLSNDDPYVKQTKQHCHESWREMFNPQKILLLILLALSMTCALCKKMRGDENTFSDLAASILYHILHQDAKSECIDIVFDVYRTIPIEDVESCNRGSNSSIQFKNISPAHNIYQWKRFLRNSVNKSALIEFLVE